MNLFRLLLLLAAAYLAWRLWQRFFAVRAAPPQDAYLPTVRCGKCGAHVATGSLSSQGLCGRCAE